MRASPVTPETLALVLSDMDGTLLNSDKQLTARAVRAVQALRGAGLRFAVTSGRSPLGMRMFLPPLALATPLAAFNGGLYVAATDLSSLRAYCLDGSLVAEVLRELESYRLDPWLYRAQDWLVRDLDGPHVAREQHNSRVTPARVESFAGLTEGVIKIVGVSDDAAAVRACEQALQTQWASRISAERSQPYYLDVTHPQANKGEVLEHLSSWLGVPRECIATIGDQENDVRMFARSGLAIAMGNAPPEVQAQAHWTTASCDEEGFALAMERLVAERAHAPGPGLLR